MSGENDKDLISRLLEENENLKRKLHSLTWLTEIQYKTIAQYFREGSSLPRVKLVGSKSGSIISRNHEPIKKIVGKQFGVIDIDDLEHCGWKTTKIFEENELLVFVESDIHRFVRNVIEDIITAAKLDNLKLYNDLAITELKADFWVMTVDGEPVAAIEMKKPGNNTEADFKMNYGRLFDHLLEIKSFRGIQNVLGLFTNWDVWHFAWLEDSDTSANATDLNYCDTIDSNASKDLIANRCLYVSPPYLRTEARKLSIALYSWLKKIHKNAKGRSNSVPMVSNNRCYIKLESKKWIWMKGLPVASLSFVPCQKNCTTFYLLYDFHCGADGRVWLACHMEKDASTNTNIGRLVVIKFPISKKSNNVALKNGEIDNDVIKEVENWRAMGVKSVYATILNCRQAIIMPFAFHYMLKGHNINNNWFESLQSSEVSIDNFDEIHNEVINQDPMNVLQECIEGCSNAKLVHDDIHWRHVAIFPQIIKHKAIKKTTKNKSYSLKSCFIDLTRMSKVSNKEEAIEKMEGDKIRLINEYKTNYNSF